MPGNPETVLQPRLRRPGVTMLSGVSSGASSISNFVLVSAEWFLERIRWNPYQHWVFGGLCKNEIHRAKTETLIKSVLSSDQEL